VGAYTVKLKERKEVAENTTAVFFDKPAGFEFAGGQSADVTLINPPETDAEGNTRAFSLASAPLEHDLMFATRLRGTAFKRVFKTMPLGPAIKIEGPFGSMTLHKKTARPGVILAGGIGITPFRSMLVQATQTNTGHRLILFYSNRRPEDAAFLAELRELAKQYPNFTLVATMTDLEKSKVSWTGETGYINKEMLAKYVKDLAEPVYCTAGPPALVAGMRKLLGEAGADADDIRSEDFSGH
jgi:ferredoxin-NADP reductase